MTNSLYLRRSFLPCDDVEIRSRQGAAQARPVRLERLVSMRVRTLSFNGFMGSPVKSPAATTYRRVTDILRPSPAEALTFLNEREETINDGSITAQWPFRESNPANWTLRDKSATAHDGAANLTFADAHVETHWWRDARTRSAPIDDAVMAGNPGILWMQKRGTWREEEE